jgi:hypothetical protein
LKAELTSLKESMVKSGESENDSDAWRSLFARR